MRDSNDDGWSVMPGFIETLSLFIDAKTGGAVRDIQTLGKSVGGVGGNMDATTAKGGFLEKQMKSLGLTSVTTGTLMVAGAVAGGLALGKLAGDAVQTTLKYTSTVRDLQRVTGASAETSSRLVAVFDDLEISQEAAAKGFFKLSREIGANNSNLGEFGVQTKDAHGKTRDLEQILLDVADAYTHTEDKGRKAALVQAAFGRGGQEMLPILEKGRKGIEDLFANVPDSQIFNQEELDAARRYELAVDNLKDAFDELQIMVGNELIPVLTDVINAIATITRGAGQLNDAINSVTGISVIGAGLQSLAIGPKLIGSLGDALGIGSHHSDEFADAQKRVAEASKAVKDAVESEGLHSRATRDAQKELAAAKEDLEGKTRTLTKALDTENTSTQTAMSLAQQQLGGVLGLASADLAYEAALQGRTEASNALVEAQNKVTAAEMAMAQLRSDGKTGTMEYAQAERDLEEAHLGVETAKRNVTKADIDAIQANLNVQTQVEKLTELVKANKLTTQEYTEKINALKEKYPELIPAIDAVSNRVQYLHGTIDGLPTHKYITIDADGNPAIAVMNDVDRHLYNLHQWSNVPIQVRAQIFYDIFGGVTSRQHGGPIPGGINQAVPILAHGGEFVLSADVVERIKAGRPSRGATVGGGEAWNGGGGGGVYAPVSVTVQGWVGNDQDLANRLGAVFNRRGGPQLASRSIARIS